MSINERHPCAPTVIFKEAEQLDGRTDPYRKYKLNLDAQIMEASNCLEESQTFHKEQKTMQSTCIGWTNGICHGLRWNHAFVLIVEEIKSQFNSPQRINFVLGEEAKQGYSKLHKQIQASRTHFREVQVSDLTEDLINDRSVGHAVVSQSSSQQRSQVTVNITQQLHVGRANQAQGSLGVLWESNDGAMRRGILCWHPVRSSSHLARKLSLRIRSGDLVLEYREETGLEWVLHR